MEILPQSEFDVMQVLWSSQPPLTSRVVVDALMETRGWTIQTVATLLGRLVKKGFLASAKEGREVRYQILIQRAEYMELETQDFVEKYRGNSVRNLLAAFADQGALSTEDFDSLSSWLDQQRRGK